MNTIGIIGLLLAISCLIVLSYKGVNAFIASLIASVVVIITNALPFWETLAGSYATGFKNFAGNYFLLFGLAAAYGEFLKVTGSAESVAKVLFKIFGVKWAPLGALLITLLMAMGGVSAFVIVFAVYPVAAPLFRKANITKNLLPGIVLCASVTLCLCLPGNQRPAGPARVRPGGQRLLCPCHGHHRLRGGHRHRRGVRYLASPAADCPGRGLCGLRHRRSGDGG